MGPIRSTLVITIALIAAGCAARKVGSDVSLTSAKQEGLVAFSVSHDRSGGRGARLIAYIDGGPANGCSMVSSLTDGAPGIPTASDFEDVYGRLYVLSLPVGKHSFSGWQIASDRSARIAPVQMPPALPFLKLMASHPSPSMKNPNVSL